MRPAVWNAAAGALAASMLAVNVYRAATQSITIDEAFTFNRFVAGSAYDAVRFYDANNHAAHTLLVWLSTAVFGVSELAVRLPSLAGGALYLAAAWRLCGRAFGGSWCMLAAMAMLSLNPFVLDYLSAARGYGLGLGFLMLALERLARYLEEGGRGRLYAAGAALGLAAAANLVFLVPGAALAAVFSAFALRGRRAGVWSLADDFAIPGIVAAFTVVVVPLSHMRPGNFYYGAGSLAESARSLTFVSLAKDGPWLTAAIALVVAASGAACARALARNQPGGAHHLAGGAMLLSLAVLVGARHAAGVLYPADRTGIYWVPLLVVAAFGTARGRAARAVVGVVALLCAAQFVRLFRVDHYAAWRFDAGTHRVVAALRARESGARRVRVAASWLHEPALNFYRRMYRLEWMEPVVNGAPDAPGDYHVLAPGDAAVAGRLGLRILYRDPVSGSVLAE